MSDKVNSYRLLEDFQCFHHVKWFRYRFDHLLHCQHWGSLGVSNDPFLLFAFQQFLPVLDALAQGLYEIPYNLVQNKMPQLNVRQSTSY